MNKAQPANELLQELRRLNSAIGNATDQQVALFLTKFEDLDKLLSEGGQFPQDWVTKTNQIQLRTDQRTVLPVPFNPPPRISAKTYNPNNTVWDDEVDDAEI